MGKTILYGVDSTNTIHEIYHKTNGMAACLPIWDYLDNKYFPNEKLSFSERHCWKLTPKMLSNEEYFMLLTSFDGYYFTKEHLSEMIELLKRTHLREVEPINSTRLELFEIASQNNDYGKFFITATTVADYEYFIEYPYDEELDDYVSDPFLKETVWDIWDEYVNAIGEAKISQPDCNTYFWGITEIDYINTLKGLYKTNPILLSGVGATNEDEVVKYAKAVYRIKDEDYGGFTVYPPDLISRIGNLEWRLARKGDSLINVWNEEQQQFKTVSLKKLIESKGEIL